MEKISTPIEINFNSNPCIGNNDNPPIAPKITANGAVHAGQPGVKAAKVPPTIDVESVLMEFIIFILFILNPIIAKLIPANDEITNVRVTDAVIYVNDISPTFSKCNGNIDIVKK